MEGVPYLREISLVSDGIRDASAYPFNIPAIRSLSSLRFETRVTYIIGENGSGKSTLLEAIAVALGFNAEGGSRNFNFRTFDTHSPLHGFLKLSRSFLRPKDGFFLRAESYYNMATNIEEMDREPMSTPPVIGAFGGVSLHGQSHGESFMSLLMHRFWGNGLYLLDEPEAALSPSRQMTALSRIHTLVQENSQFIIATHSPIIMAYPGSVIYRLDEDSITRIEYEQTEHYRITKYFLNNTEAMLRELL